MNTKKNVTGDPLSRDKQYDFRRAARQMGATKFVRLDIPQTIFTLMQEVESLFPVPRTGKTRVGFAGVP